MKIGIDIRTLMDKNYSGVSYYTSNVTREILRMAQENNPECEFKLFYNSARDVSDRFPEFVFDEDFHGTRIPNKIFNYGLQKTLRRPRLDKILGVDRFWMPHFNFTCLTPECKKFLTVHDISFLRHKDFFSPRRNIWHRILNVKKTIRQADKIIAISRSTKRDIMELCDQPPNKIEVVPGGVDPRYTPLYDHPRDLDKIKKKYDLPDNFLLYLGNLDTRKNVEGIIKAFDIFAQKYKRSDYYLVVAGMPGWGYDRILRAWKQCARKDKIKFLGYAPEEDKKYFYNLASVFVFPSFYEGFGLPPLEAMACGTPVITGCITSLPEVVGDAGLLADPYNVRDIFEAMRRILLDENLRIYLSQKSLQRSKQFSWEKTARRYLEIITS